jgi:glycosyltransferase involved in cell wall biosynthesis
VAGFLAAPSGIGASARGNFDLFSRLGLNPTSANISPLAPVDGMIPWADDGRNDMTSGPIVIHANPPEFPAALARLGRRQIANRLVIGYWAWELEHIPDSWARAFELVHEVWTPSTFVAAAMRKRTGKPVRVVPPIIDLPTGPRPLRETLGLPADRRIVLAGFDARSSVARKNPMAAIEAFRLAFGDSPDALLVMKVLGRKVHAAADMVCRTVEAMPNAKLVDAVLTPDEMLGLVEAADVVLSLHRSEGFGILPAQALLLGKPVIATDWSGSRDFLTPDSFAAVPARLIPVADPQGIYPSEGRWADPDIAVAAVHLRRLAHDAQARRDLSDAARSASTRFFDPVRLAENLGVPFWQACGQPASPVGVG